MGKYSGIAWTDHTFNPWWGCFKISAGCRSCYAKTLADRFSPGLWEKDGKRRMFPFKHWDQLRAWNDAERPWPILSPGHPQTIRAFN